MNRGIALLTAIFSLMLILIVGSLALFLVVRSMGVSAGQARYQSTFEATEGGVELGLAEVDEAFKRGETNFLVDSTVQKIGGDSIIARAKFLSSVTVSGGALDFARGYEGIGASIAKGGVMSIYLVPSAGIGPTKVRVNIDVSVRKTSLGGS